MNNYNRRLHQKAGGNIERKEGTPLCDSSVMPWRRVAFDVHLRTTNLERSCIDHRHSSHVFTDGTRTFWPG